MRQIPCLQLQPAMSSIQHRTALAFLDTFKDLDYEANVALRTPDCRHVIAPASLGYTEKTNEQFAKHLKSMQKSIKAIPVTPKQVFEGSNSITVWATSETIFQEDVKARDSSLDWTYEGEYMFVFAFNETGDKIQHILEFIDSKKVEQMRKLLPNAPGVSANAKESG